LVSSSKLDVKEMDERRERKRRKKEEGKVQLEVAK
jgi:hypothetical protein